MREFYLLYRDDERVQPLVAQIGWTHNLAILQRCKDPLEREFYLRITHPTASPAGKQRLRFALLLLLGG